MKERAAISIIRKTAAAWLKVGVRIGRSDGSRWRGRARKMGRKHRSRARAYHPFRQKAFHFGMVAGRPDADNKVKVSP